MKPETTAEPLLTYEQIDARDKMIAQAVCDQVQIEMYELKERLSNAEWKLRQLGYERCSSIACNCKGYHFNGRD